LQDGTASYLYGPGGLLLEQIDSGGTPYYYHADQLGSIRALTNGSGAVANHYTYDAYGQRTTTGSAYNPFGYAGEYTDAESGLLYLRARYYDPATQQFLTVDPLLAWTEQAYNYVDGNPLNATDPAGLCSNRFDCEHSGIPAHAMPGGAPAWSGRGGSSASSQNNPAYVGVQRQLPPGNTGPGPQRQLPGGSTPLTQNYPASCSTSAGRAARGNAGERALEALYGPGYKNISYQTSRGGRKPDLVVTQGNRIYAHESINNKRPVGNGGHKLKEALKDYELMQTNLDYTPVWHFWDAGPTAALARTLQNFGIRYIVYRP
jgi:RHS repeat-associated protein